jgi:GntR family transcriptional regulator, trigonelline degradation regulator
MSTEGRPDEEAAPPLGRVGRVAAPLRQQVLAILRGAILDFRFQPGQRLVARELMEELQVSRTTIREVLRELAAEGLVTSIPQRGLVVAMPTVEEARELYEVRGAMEALALRGFIARAGDEELAGLRAALDAFAAAVGTGDVRALLAAKDAGAAILLAGCGNEAVRTIQRGLRARARALDAASFRLPGRPAAELAELRLVLEATERRDADAAVAASTAHLEATGAAGLAALQQAGALSGR